MNLTTPVHKIWPMRATGPEDTLLDLTTAGDFAQKPDGTLDLLKETIQWNEQQAKVMAKTLTNAVEIYMMASDAPDKTFNWYLTAWRNENGPAKRVAEGTAITGTQAVVKYPHNGEAVANMYWCDTVEVTAEDWPKEVESTGGDLNSVNSLWIDAIGYRYFLMEFITTGTTAPATNIAAYYGRF